MAKVIAKIKDVDVDAEGSYVVTYDARRYDGTSYTEMLDQQVRQYQTTHDPEALNQAVRNAARDGFVADEVDDVILRDAVS